MPNIWTHLIFGHELLQEVGQSRLIDAKYERNVFNMGCQGPDFLFYHNFLPWRRDKKMNRLGSAMHSEHCGHVLADMVKFVHGRELDDPAVVYVIGFIAHHILDRNAHPFVFYNSGFKKWNHQRYEVIIDTLVAYKKLGLETWKTPVWRQLDIGTDFPPGIINMFTELAMTYYPELTEDVYPVDWTQSYRDMIAAHKLFHDPLGWKRFITINQIEPMVYKRRNRPLDYLNESGTPWNDPTNENETYSYNFWDLWQIAIADGEFVLREAIRLLTADNNDNSLNNYRELTDRLGNISYETGKPCDSGLKIKNVNPLF